MTTYDTVVQRAYQAAQIPLAEQDPTLARQIQVRVSELTPELAGPDSQGEGYLAKLGRLTAARQQAVELALADLLPTPKTAATSPTDTSPEATTQDNETGEVEMPLAWPADPAHPLNDEDLVEQMSQSEITRLLTEFDQSQAQQNRLRGEENYRREIWP